MINSLKQHEKTFRKFVEWIEKNRWTLKITYFIEQGNIKGISDRELLSLLVEFCDSEGYYILPNINIIEEWYYEIELRGNIGEDVAIEKMNYGSRSKATQGAIKKCFELMEKNNR